MAIYMWREPITTAWIYHNATLGLISLSSDWENWITIADKNLWATSTDITSQSSYGNYFQWGNCYWFPISWHGAWQWPISAAWYWPNNYYNDRYFVYWNAYWDSSNNANLWWWITWTNEAMRWPCDTWFHIPSITEFNNLLNLWINIWAWTASGWDNMRDILLLPYWWVKAYSSSSSRPIYSAWTYWYYWTANNYSNTNSYNLEFSSTINHTQNAAKAWGMNIRPFKNEAVQPDESRTVLYQ